MAYRILCVEDNAEIGKLLTESLAAADYACDWVRDGEAALALLAGDAAPRYDLVMLDLMLPGVDGLEVCRRLRRHDSLTPVLMVTAKAAIRDVVVGLEIGADDYVTKPFAMPILLARVQALLRRGGRQVASVDDGIVAAPPLVYGPLVIDVDQHRVTLEGKPVQLTGKEFALLTLFARHPGHGFSRGELLDRVWGEEFDGYDHTVNTHINRLRGKIEANPARPRFIQTVWGVGYRFVGDEAS
ncbi:response regulator transcription factor [Billgrantia azerbaijanica]|nr:response regulator transcription factor [Halomonas azerbaijanica]